MNYNVIDKLKLLTTISLSLCAIFFAYIPAHADGVKFKFVDIECMNNSEVCLNANLNKANGVVRVSSNDMFDGFKLIVAEDLVNTGLTENEVAQILHKGSDRYSVTMNTEDNVIAIAKAKELADLLVMHPRQIFYAIKGDTLKQTIDRWASYEKVKVIWNASLDYKLSASADFEGELFSSNGPLYQILKLFQNSEHPFEAKLMSNQILLIKSKAYSSDMLIVQK